MKATNTLTAKQHERLLKAHGKQIEKNSEYGIDNFNIGSSSGDNWISSKGYKERLTSSMSAIGKIIHSWE